MIGLATTPGLPAAVAPIIWLNALENMKDWYCSKASSSHIPANVSCSTRLTSGAALATSTPAPSPLRHAGRVPAAAISLIRLSSLAPARTLMPGSSSSRKPFSRDPDRRRNPLLATRECRKY